MKKILKLMIILTIANTAGKIFNGEKLQYPTFTETVECLHNVASDVMELAEMFGCTFNYSTESQS